jgi:DMSO/TMAO reductase YedYZ molybdopterin-dependent catalytic subunit
MKVLVLKWICLAILAVMGSGCEGEETRRQPDYQPRTLEPVEVNQYQGEKLSSWQEFRENSIKGPQHIDLTDYSLKITGYVNNPGSFSYQELVEREKFKKIVALNCVEGWSVKILWEGILVRELLDEAGVDNRAQYVVFYGHDGYSTFFTLNYIMDNDILMAYKMNDIILPPERGFPFALVAEQKWGYKWIKWITRIELSDNIDGKGFWENYGYSIDGDLDKYFFRQ